MLMHRRVAVRLRTRLRTYRRRRRRRTMAAAAAIVSAARKVPLDYARGRLNYKPLALARRQSVAQRVALRRRPSGFGAARATRFRAHSNLRPNKVASPKCQRAQSAECKVRRKAQTLRSKRSRPNGKRQTANGERQAASGKRLRPTSSKAANALRSAAISFTPFARLRPKSDAAPAE